MPNLTPNQLIKAESTGARYAVSCPWTEAATGVAPYLSGTRNVIINGDMAIWQRGTSTSITGASAYLADRWQVICSGGSGLACTNALDSDVPTMAQAGTMFNYSNKITITTAEASITGTELLCWKYTLEGYDAKKVWQRDCVFSFWFKSSKSGTYGIGFDNFGGGTPDRAFAAPFTYNSASGWTKQTFTIPASPSTGTWNLTNGTGLQIYITLACGSSYQQGTPNQWNTVATYNCATSTISNTAADTNGNAFYLTGVQLEVGTVATPFEIRHFQQELALCQRYCFVLDGVNGYYHRVSYGSIATGGSTFYFWTQAPVPMRTQGGAINATHNITTGLTNGTPASTAICVFNNNAQAYAFGTYSSFSAVNYSGGSLYLAVTGTSLSNATAGSFCYYLLGSGVRIVFSDEL